MRIIMLFFGDYDQKYALYKRRFNGGIMLQMFSTWSYPLSNAILCSPFFLSVVMPHLGLFLLVRRVYYYCFVLFSAVGAAWTFIFERSCVRVLLKRVYEYCCSSLKRRTGIFGGKQRKNKPTISLWSTDKNSYNLNVNANKCFRRLSTLRVGPT